MSHAGKIIELRDLIARHASAPPPRRSSGLLTGIDQLDQTLAGGLVTGGAVEVVCPPQAIGGSSLMVAVLRQLGRSTALIDGHDTFDPQSVGPDLLAHLLWVRCRKTTEAIRAADLLLRDGNLSLIFLDLRDNAASELRKISSSTWYRFQRMLEPTAVALLVFTPRPLVPCARARLELRSVFDLRALEMESGELARAFRLEPLLRGVMPIVDQERAYARAG